MLQTLARDAGRDGVHLPEQLERTRDALRTNREALDRIVNVLLEREEID
jgi:hypothetical protein